MQWILSKCNKVSLGFLSREHFSKQCLDLYSIITDSRQQVSPFFFGNASQFCVSGFSISSHSRHCTVQRFYGLYFLKYSFMRYRTQTTYEQKYDMILNMLEYPVQDLLFEIGVGLYEKLTLSSFKFLFSFCFIHIFIKCVNLRVLHYINVFFYLFGQKHFL